MKNRMIGSVALGAAVVAMSVLASAQGGGRREPSPEGKSTTQIGGKWIDITYGRPIKRGRDVFGSGADYGKITHVDGAAIWRAGANVTTRLKTEAPLVIERKDRPRRRIQRVHRRREPDEVDLHPVQLAGADASTIRTTKKRSGDPSATRADKDVVRAPMKVDTLPFSIDEMSWEFVDVTAAGGKLAVMWDKTMASVPFKLGS